jgi:small Trp-rich protein
MWFIVIGVLLLVMKLADFGTVADWSWWLVLSPFALAVAWWAWADATGFTKRAEMRRMEERKQERRRKNMEALGMDYRKYDRSSRKAAAFQQMQAAQAQKVEVQRDAKRQKNRDSVVNSRFDSQMGQGDAASPRRR